jgi:LysR family nitrogen assimilation transcriptional regulator
LDIKSLRLFLGIIKHRSITKASRHLYIAQPALGLYLRRLEDELGVELVTRHARGVTPSAAGLKLAEHAERLISQMHYIKNELQNLRDTPSGPALVGLTHGTGQLLAAQLIKRIALEYPDIAVCLRDSISESLAKMLNDGRLDLALTYAPSDDQDLRFKPIGTETLVLTYWKDSVSEKVPEEIKFRDLVNYPLILPSKKFEYRRLVEGYAEQLGLYLNVVHEVESVQPIRYLIREGLGFSVGSIGAVKWEVDCGHVGIARIVDPVPTRTLYLAENMSKPSSRAIEVVRDQLVALVAEVAHEHPDILSVEDFNLEDDPEQAD